MGAAALVVLATSVLLLRTLGADIAYYMHLARGQTDVLLDRLPVEDVLGDPTTSAAVREGLLLIEEVRRFASQHVGLKGSSSNYTTYYDTGGEPIAWNVSASPPERFESYRWTFPIVGSLPYKGYFRRQLAVDERDRLVELGFDAIVGAVSAYSTLGYLSDPILSTMLDEPESRLVELVLHELTHATIYVEDHTDYNESVASFVGKAGTDHYLTQRYGEDSEPVLRLRRRRAEAEIFRGFLRELTVRLDSLYESDSPRERVLRTRVTLFEDGKQEYRRRRQDLGNGRFDGFLDWDLNNARLLSYRRYNSRFDDLAAVLRRRQGDLPAALKVFAICGESEEPWVCIETDSD